MAVTTTEGSSPGIEPLLRDLAPHVLGALVRRYGDFGIAEDAVQEALLAGALQWPTQGLPENPRGWLIQVASRRMTDRVRREQARRLREERVVMEAADRQASAADDEWATERDDTLILLFMCCHPVLTPASAIALTLRAVGGLTTAEIAKAFLVPEATMAQRISRAKQSIKSSGARFDMPTDREWAQRMGLVLHVLYLIFNEGYTTSTGPHLQRTDLSNEAIRLTRILHGLVNGTARGGSRFEGAGESRPEVTGLLALMLLTDARRAARVGPNGELIPLAEQDRAKWDRAAIEEGVALISDALPRGAVGPYQLQAAIAAVHDEAPRVEDTDWPQILALYGVLERMSDNPMVTLNHAIARAMVDGPAAGLALLATLDASGRLAGHHRLHAVRAHLLEMAGDHEAALAEYRIAAGRTASEPERQYLLMRAARLGARTGDDRASSSQGSQA